MFEGLGSRAYARPALFEIDRKLEAYLDFDGGSFVECGANDGYSQSNTYYFEKCRGWRGVLIEPVPYLYWLCRRMRPEALVFNCALAARDGGALAIQPADLCSGVVEPSGPGLHKGILVPSRTLSAVLAEAGLARLDLLSLDVEGYELAVLRGVDFGQHVIRFILVETAALAAVRAILEPRFHLVDQLSFHDYLFRLAD
jgi:FkbM family methyltransferase